MTMFGGTLNIDTCNLVDNRLTNPGGGSAFCATAQPAAGGLPDWDVAGSIQNCVISNNGGPFYDLRCLSAPHHSVEGLQHKGNQFYPPIQFRFFYRHDAFAQRPGYERLTLILAWTAVRPEGACSKHGAYLARIHRGDFDRASDDVILGSAWRELAPSRIYRLCEQRRHPDFGRDSATKRIRSRANLCEHGPHRDRGRQLVSPPRRHQAWP